MSVPAIVINNDAAKPRQRQQQKAKNRRNKQTTRGNNRGVAPSAMRTRAQKARTGRQRAKASSKASALGEGVMGAIIKSFALPGGRPFRWNDPYVARETAVATPKRTFNTEFGDGASGPIPASDWVAFVSRDPTRASVVYRGNPLGLFQYYEAFFSQPVDSQTPQKAVTDLIVKGNVDDPDQDATWIYPNIAFMSDNSDGQPTPWTPHGTVYYPFGIASEPKRWVWIDASAAKPATVVLAQPVSIDTSQFTFAADLWEARGINETILAATSTAGGLGAAMNIPLTVTKPGYYAFKLRATGLQSDATCQIYETSAAPSMAHLSLPDFEKNAAAAPSIKTIAASIYIENTVSALNAEGKVTAFQFPKGTDWTTFAYGGYANFAKVAKNWKGQAKNGFFGWLKPGTEADLSSFQTPLDFQGDFTTTNSCIAPIEGQSSYIGVYLQIESAAGRSFEVTTYYGVEYESQDTWRDIQSASVSIDVYRAALSKLKDMDQFFENPTHIMDIVRGIKNAVKSVANTALSVGPTVMKIAELLK